MPELRHFDPQQALAMVCAAEEQALERVHKAGMEARQAVQDAAEGARMLEHGVGPILERAACVYVATFVMGGYAEADGGVRCQPVLRFEGPAFMVTLDPTNWWCGQDTKMPRLEVGRRYRTIVTIEPTD